MDIHVQLSWASKTFLAPLRWWQERTMLWVIVSKRAGTSSLKSHSCSSLNIFKCSLTR